MNSPSPIERGEGEKLLTGLPALSRLQNLSLGQIARFLNQTGVPAPRDSQKWHPETVRRIILSEDEPSGEADLSSKAKDQLNKDISLFLLLTYKEIALYFKI